MCTYLGKVIVNLASFFLSKQTAVFAIYAWSRIFRESTSIPRLWNEEVDFPDEEVDLPVVDLLMGFDHYTPWKKKQVLAPEYRGWPQEEFHLSTIDFHELC